MQRKSEMWRNTVYNLWCFVAFYNILLQNQFFLRFTLFCREISFGMIYALLRGEKFSQKLCLWRKNYKYEVCHRFIKWSWIPNGKYKKGERGLGCLYWPRLHPDPTMAKKTYIQDKRGPEWPAQVMAHMRSLNRTDGLVNGVDQWPIFETSANATGADNLTSVNLGKCMNFFTIRFSCHPRNHGSVVWVPRPERPSRGPSGPAW